MINININQIQAQLELELDKSWRDLCIKRPFIANLPYEKFAEWMIISMQKIMFRMKDSRKAVIDVDNEFVIKNIHKWFIGDNSFETIPGTKGNLYKGIILIGNIGCRKSTVLEAAASLYMTLTNRVMVRIEAEKLDEYFKTKHKDINHKGEVYDTYNESIEIKKHKIFNGSTKFIDDIGRESKTVKDWGNTIHPMKKLLTHCYDCGILVFGTSNFPKEEQLKIYENYLGTRLLSFCNYMPLKGENMRDI